MNPKHHQIKEQMYVVNVQAAVLKEMSYLMIMRSNLESHAANPLDLPGGKVEVTRGFGVLEETLQREIYEEVGVEVDHEMVYVDSSAFIADDGVDVVNVVFLSRYKTGVPHPRDISELTSVEWMGGQVRLSHTGYMGYISPKRQNSPVYGHSHQSHFALEDPECGAVLCDLKFCFASSYLDS